MSTPAPTSAIHFLNMGALLRSQPETPPSNSIGDRAVPKPNKTAKRKLSIGAPKDREYKRNIANGGHTINPLLKPSEKAPTSNLTPNLFKPEFLCPTGSQSRGVALLFKRTAIPMTIVTMPKTKEEYC